MTVDEIMAEMKPISEAAETRALNDDEVSRYEELETQLTAARKSEEIVKRQKAYETPIRTDLHIHAGGQEVTPELRAFQHYCLTGEMNPEYRAMTEGTSSAGGYLIPTTTQAKIVERLKAFGGLQAEAEQLNTNSGEPINWATEDDTANTAEIVAEGAAAASAGADKVLGQVSLGAYKYEATGASNLPMKVSWELLQDSPINLEDHIAKNFARRIARKFAVDICTGTGVGQPQGIVTPQTAFAQTASNTVITYPELLSAVQALDPEYRANAKWLMNDATWGVVLGMVDTTNRPLLLPEASAGVGGRIPQQLLGYPVVIDQGMPAYSGSNKKAIVFGDLQESYIVRIVKGFQLLRLNELYALNGFVGFLGWARMDGKVQNLNSYVVLASKT